MTRPDRARIRALNDLLRIRHRGGVVMISAGVKEMGIRTVRRILHAVATFDAFTPDNDPHGEHSYGSLIYEGRCIVWKIDYYGSPLIDGSSASADPDRATRVLTVMFIEEY